MNNSTPYLIFIRHINLAGSPLDTYDIGINRLSGLLITVPNFDGMLPLVEVIEREVLAEFLFQQVIVIGNVIRQGMQPVCGLLSHQKVKQLYGAFLQQVIEAGVLLEVLDPFLCNVRVFEYTGKKA